MKPVIKWAVNNSPAMNSLLIASLLVGAASLVMMRREVFPEFELEVVLVTVPYPGTRPEEVEEGVCQKIEEAVQGIDGIKRQTSVAKEGSGFVILELDAGVDVQRVLNEVRSEIDQIPSLPELAEDPDVKQITFRVPAVRLAVIAPDDADIDDADVEFQLREIAEEVRDDLLQLQPAPPSNPVRAVLGKMFGTQPRSVVSSVNILGAKDYQIDVEIPEDTLRKYNLTLREIAQIIRRQNVELPGGNIKTAGQELLVVGKDKSSSGKAIGDIEVLTQRTGAVLTLEDLGEIKDGFNDATMISEVNGRPALVVSADRTSDEDLLFLVENVRRYAAEKVLPAGYDLQIWYDQSVDVKDRMDMLLRNGLQGLVLVFLTLAIFLELRLAFWVALGIPIAILGAGAILLLSGQTLNMLSMFAFLMALGIVVDDAIVIGENIFQHRQRGKGFVKAAIDGTFEVLPSVAASVSTTIIAFMPLAFVAGVMGKFIAVMPVAVISMLVISLVESTFILPCHLAHEDNLVFRIIGIIFYPLKFVLLVFRWLNSKAATLLQFMVNRTYLPAMRWGLKNPLAVLAASVGLMIVAVGFVKADIVPFTIFPKLDTRIIEASLVYPDGTPAETTAAGIRQIEKAMLAVNEEYKKKNGKPLILLRHKLVGQVAAQGPAGPTATASGSHVGRLTVELAPPDEREIKSQQVIEKWRAAAGNFPGAESVSFKSESFGPGATPIEFKLLAPEEKFGELQVAAERCKAKLAEYDGVIDIEDDSRPGKWEMQFSVDEFALSMGILNAELAETVRASYYGEEVMRLQRGRHEVKLMVRYPEKERESMASFKDIRIRSEDGAERPLTELAQVEHRRGISEINRVDQLRSITVFADIEEGKANARRITQELQSEFMPQLLKEFPDVRVRWEGQEDQSRESIKSLFVGFFVALLAMYVLLTLEFRSYFQPLIILAIIPFGLIGAVVGHAVMGLEMTLFSLFGLVALTGVVVNDSIVLIDFINHRLQEGLPLKQAIAEAGRRRFRPVLLTSVTTVAGLIPLLFEGSFQAQILIPMATSLCFGLLFATGLVLILVPTFYYIYARLFLHLRRDESNDADDSLLAPKLDDKVDQIGEPVPA